MTKRIGRLALVVLLLSGCMLGLPSRASTSTSLIPAWTRLIAANDLPPARSQFGMAIDRSGTLYVFGGRGPDGVPIADFWSWRGRDQTWRLLSSNGMPALVEPHLAVDAAGNVYEFGGIGQPGGKNFSNDGHSLGLYQYNVVTNRWADLTAPDGVPNVDWPVGREDHGFTYVPTDDSLWVFAGEGPGNQSLGDMWRYSLSQHIWTRVQPRYSGSASIDPREIYAISYDGHGGMYLFGGAYVQGPDHHPVRWEYVNDLWRFDVATQRWTLLAGHANAYDPTVPLPRHYFGQACDAAGNFYLLGGYVSDTVDTSGGPPFFANDLYNLYAQVVAFSNETSATGDIAYAVGDFWQFDATRHAWTDLTTRLGDLGSDPFIPYVMVADPSGTALLTFGGYHQDDDGLLAPSAQVWRYTLPTPVAPGAAATGTAVPTAGR